VSECQGHKSDGTPCGAQAVDGQDYCRHHLDQRDEVEESSKVVSATPKQVGRQSGPKESDVDLEKRGVDSLVKAVDDARGAGTLIDAGRALLEHYRWRQNRRDEDGE